MTNNDPLTSIQELLEPLLNDAKDKQEAWAATEVKLAVVGKSGTGKSSLINAILGERKAATGPTEQTQEVACFDHNGVTICDLPGCGTEREPAEGYVARHALLEEFDLHIVVVANRIYEGDVELAKHLATNGQAPYVVRSMMDRVADSAPRDGLTREEAFVRARTDIQDQLGQSARSIYLVSAYSPRYDLPNLLERVSEALDGAKRDRFLAGVASLSDELIDQKVRIAKEVAGRLALLAAANGLNPVPGLNISIDLGLVRELVTEVRSIFDLDDESLRYYAQILGQDLDAEITGRLGVIVKELAKYSGQALVKQLAAREGAKTAAKYLPFVGPVISAGAGYALMSYFGSTLVEDCAEQARNLARELANATTEEPGQA